MNERCRAAVEILGVVLVILGVAMFSVALGVILAGVVCVYAATFYRTGEEEDDDAPG